MRNIKLWILTLCVAAVARLATSQGYKPANVPNPTVGAKVGSSSNFSCDSNGVPIKQCLWEKSSSQGDTTLISFDPGMRDGQPSDVSGYSYRGRGLENGDCGVLINQVKDNDNAIWKCTLFISGGVIRGEVDVSILKKPDNPKFAPERMPEIIDDSANGRSPQSQRLTCYSANGQPPPKFEWYLGDQPLTEGLENINTTRVNGTPNIVTYQNLNRQFTWADNGKQLRCRLMHDALSQNEISEATASIDVKFAPRSEGEASPSRQIYVPNLGEKQVLALNISANPRPNIRWEVDGVQINEGFSTTDKRYQAESLRPIVPGIWEARLMIPNVNEEDLEKVYKIEAKNLYGTADFEIRISSVNPSEGGLSAGGIVGLVLGLPALLIIIAVIVVYSRARGLLCFKGDVGKENDSEKERMDGGSAAGEEKPKQGFSSRLNAIYENFMAKKKDKTAPSDEESAKEKKDQPIITTATTEGESKNGEGDKKPDDIVYAELDLAKDTGGGRPKPEDADKTEYAEIIGVAPEPKKSPAGSNNPSPKK